MLKMATILPDSDVLGVEKRGLELVSPEALVNDDECPRSYYQHESLFKRTEDYRKVLNALSADYEQMIVLGGSEGAIIAGLLRQEDLPITATISLNGGGQHFRDDIFWSIEKAVPESDRASALAGVEEFIQDIQTMTANALDEMKENPSNHSVRWWFEMLSLDMLDVWQKGDHPLLMIQTLGDNNVSVPSAMTLFKDLEEYSHIHTLAFPALDHGFHDENGASKVDEIIQQIQYWLKPILEDI